MRKKKTLAERVLVLLKKNRPGMRAKDIAGALTSATLTYKSACSGVSSTISKLLSVGLVKVVPNAAGHRIFVSKAPDGYDLSEVNSPVKSRPGKKSDIKITNMAMDKSISGVTTLKMDVECTGKASEMWKARTQEPLIGLTPRWIVVASRFNDIMDAMREHSGANKVIPLDWISEAQELFALRAALEAKKVNLGQK